MQVMHEVNPEFLFGGDKNWNSADWTASDDHVRGGNSRSYLNCRDASARFHGNLDIKTLGGAGFASQRTTSDDLNWDLSDYAGIEICVSKSDEKQYTFILKDETLPPDADSGREQSTLSYEYDFKGTTTASNDSHLIFIPWDQFKATYRGKEKKDVPSLDLRHIKRASLMMRSFFGTQEGDFALTMDSIAATTAQTPGPRI